MNIVNELSDMAVQKEFGRRISAHRVSARMTQEELARRAGVSKRSVERLEKGEGGVRFQIIIAVARALRCLGGLNVFVPDVAISPYHIVGAHIELPKRVRARKNPVRSFKWGE